MRARQRAGQRVRRRERLHYIVGTLQVILATIGLIMIAVTFVSCITNMELALKMFIIGFGLVIAGVI